MGYEDDHTSADAAASPDVQCPACGYSLRGLPGVVVRCPECGRQWDLPELIARRRRDWTSNRLYGLLGNAGVTLLAALLIVLLVPVTAAIHALAAVVVFLCGLAMLGFWFSLIVRVFQCSRVSEAIMLIVLMQILVAMFIICGVLLLPGLLALAGGAIDAMFSQRPLVALAISAVGAATVGVAIGGLLICRRLDRFIGRRCIEWDLRRSA